MHALLPAVGQAYVISFIYSSKPHTEVGMRRF